MSSCCCYCLKVSTSYVVVVWVLVAGLLLFDQLELTFACLRSLSEGDRPCQITNYALFLSPGSKASDRYQKNYKVISQTSLCKPIHLFHSSLPHILQTFLVTRRSCNQVSQSSYITAGILYIKGKMYFASQDLQQVGSHSALHANRKVSLELPSEVCIFQCLSDNSGQASDPRLR